MGCGYLLWTHPSACPPAQPHNSHTHTPRFYRVHHPAFRLPPEAEEPSFPPSYLLSSYLLPPAVAAGPWVSCGQPFRGQKTLNIPPIRPPSSPEPLAGGAGQAHALSGGDLPAGQICCHENQAVFFCLDSSHAGKRLASACLPGHL